MNLPAKMTKGERDDLQRLIRQRERALKSAAEQRSAEMLAEFEQQLASTYAWDQEETWKDAYERAKAVIDEANEEIGRRCRELGIPPKFAPKLHAYWAERGENMIRERRQELTRVAKSRIGAIEKAALTQIELESVRLQTEIAANGLTSEAAQAFLGALPSMQSLMPSLEMPKIEAMLENRGSRRR